MAEFGVGAFVRFLNCVLLTLNYQSLFPFTLFMEIYTMIKEAKNLVRDLAAAITPSALTVNEIHPLDVTGSYDWNAQAYSYDVCKFGTTNRTQSGTFGPGWNVPNDTNWDSIQD